MSDRTFLFSLTKIDFYNSNGFQQLPCFLRGDVDLCGFQFFLKSPVGLCVYAYC